MTDEISLSEFDARGLLELAGPLEPHLDRLQLSYVDDRTILAVGFGLDTTRSRRVGTGRVAWLRRQFRAHADDRQTWKSEAPSGSRSLTDVVGRMISVVERDIDSVDDLYALFTWLKGDS